jgi:mannobiose 2-epimerase
LRHPEADKGAILNGRILWAFSAAYGATRNTTYLVYASRAARYLIDRFIDRDYGGVYWSLDCKGNPKETKKQFYALGFAIYGLSEYARITAGIRENGLVPSEEALEKAISLFGDIEEHSFDTVGGGYLEALSRDWRPLADMRLSEKDGNFSKTMNTHLHIIEPYANLYKIWKSPLLHDRIRNLLDIFFCKIENPVNHHLGLFFDDGWHVQDGAESYGHDIEASWLLLETAQILGDGDMLGKAKKHTLDIAEAALQGLQKDGSMINGRRADGSPDRDRDWWVQAETVIGTLYLARFHDIPEGFSMSGHTFDYIMTRIRDYDNGEWIWSIRADGSRNLSDDKTGFWKCPYHNSRMCMVASSLL